LNERHRRFVAEYLNDLNATRAYKAVYKCSDRVANVNGSRLLANANITAAIAAGQSKVVTKLELTVEAHLERLRALSIAAEADGQYSAAVKAEELRGKVSGFYVEKVEHSGRVDMTPDEREKAIVGILTTARKRQKELVS
jgi:phage terminase small subunit